MLEKKTLVKLSHLLSSVVAIVMCLEASLFHNNARLNKFICDCYEIVSLPLKFNHIFCCQTFHLLTKPLKTAQKISFIQSK